MEIPIEVQTALIHAWRSQAQAELTRAVWKHADDTGAKHTSVLRALLDGARDTEDEAWASVGRTLHEVLVDHHYCEYRAIRDAAFADEVGGQ